MRTRRGIVAALLFAAAGLAVGCDDDSTVAGNRMSDMAGMSEADTATNRETEGTAEMDGMEMSAGGGTQSVRLAPGETERIGLRWSTAEVRPLVRTVRTAAVVEYPESEMQWVSPKMGGWVEKLHVTFEGAPVRRGQPLIDVYSPELVTAQEELLLARRLDERLDSARGEPGADARTDSRSRELFATAQRRLRFWDISDAQIERLLETGEVRKTLTLQAPASGIVMKKNVYEGQGIRPGENLMMIAPTDRVWIETAIYEQDLPFVRTGLPAEITVQGLPGRTFTGRIGYLYPALEGSSRTVMARVEVPNPDGVLRPGMFATTRIENPGDSVLSVPSSAVLHTGARDVVFVRTGPSRLTPTVVETGRAGDARTEILAGLEPGATVATSAQFLLDSEANIAEAMQAMMAQMGQSGGDMESMDMEDMDMEAAPDTGRRVR